MKLLYHHKKPKAENGKNDNVKFIGGDKLYDAFPQSIREKVVKKCKMVDITDQDVIGFLAEVQDVFHQGKLYEDIHQLTSLVTDVSNLRLLSFQDQFCKTNFNNAKSLYWSQERDEGQLWWLSGLKSTYLLQQRNLITRIRVSTGFDW